VREEGLFLGPTAGSARPAAGANRNFYFTYDFSRLNEIGRVAWRDDLPMQLPRKARKFTKNEVNEGLMPFCNTAVFVSFLCFLQLSSE
jgi:hypothetical protein